MPLTGHIYPEPVFKWTQPLWDECLLLLHKTQPESISQVISEFIRSKTQYDVVTKIVRYNQNSYNLWVSGSGIPDEKFPMVRKTIEHVLNGKRTNENEMERIITVNEFHRAAQNSYFIPQNSYFFWVSGNGIPEEKFPAIKYAIERVLNGKKLPEKPVLGVIPYKVWIENRFDDVKAAIHRHDAAGETTPKELIDEYDHLVRLRYLTEVPVLCQPEPKKTWEILTCYIPNRSIHQYNLVGESHITSCEQQGCKIHSVKRLPDGEIFTIGGKNFLWGEIIGFEVQGDKMNILYAEGQKSSLDNAVKEKHWEILQFKSPSGNIATLQPDGLYDFPGGVRQWTMKEVIDAGNYIHRIERLEDGHVFTVGDQVTNKEYIKHGKYFSISEIKFNNHVDYGISITGNGYFISFSLKEAICRNQNNNEEKTIKPAQHYFHDTGALITDLDRFWSVDKTFPRIVTSRQTYRVGGHYPDDILRFSTEEAAKEHIVQNTACLSIKDITKTLGYDGEMEAHYKKSVPYKMLLEMAKEKLKIK